MSDMLRKLFGMGPKVDLEELIRRGATILDVRSKAEFDRGHVEGALHVPLDHLLQNLSRIAKDKPVITCCASGLRSASAAALLRDHGFEAHNGGPWTTIHGMTSTLR